MPKDSSSPEATPGSPPPRAFAQGAGLLLQTVGGVMFLSTCCLCSGAGVWDPVMSPAEVSKIIDRNQPVGMGWSELLAQPGRAGVMLTVFFCTLGGLALLIFGLGLQAEKPRSAWGAMISSVVLLLVLLAAGVGLWLEPAGLMMRLWHLLLTLTAATLTPFCYLALRQFRRHPPPTELQVLPRDFDPKQHH